MPTLGYLLNTAIESKNINKRMLCERLGISRSLLYRYLSGKAIPSIEMLRKISLELMLTPSEIEMIEEAHEIAGVGVDRYQSRMLIEHFLKNPVRGQAPYFFDPQAYSVFIQSLQLKNAAALKGKDQVRMALRYVMDSAMRQGGESIYMLAQPNNEPVMSEVSRLLRMEDNTCEIYHLYKLCQNKTLNIDTPLAYNVEVQRNALYCSFPFSAENKGYYPAYFYDSSLTQFKSTIYQHISIAAKNHAIVISDSNDTGVFFSDLEITGILRDSMAQLHQNSTPLIKRDIDLARMPEAQIAKICCNAELSIAPQPMPIFARARIHLEKSTHNEADAVKAVGRMIHRCEEELKNGLGMVSLFTMEGLNEFAATGQLSISAEEKIPPLDIQRRLDYLKSIYGYALRYPSVSLHIVNSIAAPYLQNYSLFLYKDTELRLAPGRESLDGVYTVSEKSIVKSASDYFFNIFIAEPGVLSKADTMQIMKNTIESLNV